MAIAATIKKDIAAGVENFMTNFKRRDAAGMAELYTEDGQLMPPNSDFVTGKLGIQAVWQSVMDMGVKEAKLEIVELEDTRRYGHRSRQIHDVRGRRASSRFRQIYRHLEK